LAYILHHMSLVQLIYFLWAKFAKQYNFGNILAGRHAFKVI